MYYLNLFINYTRYRFISKTPHDIHSPFIYNLLTQVIRDKNIYSCYAPIELLRNKLLMDERLITIQDLGAGSKLNSSSVRKVKDLARNAAKPAKYAQLLFRLVHYFKPAVVLELGTSLGLSTLYLAAGHKNARIITIEGCPQTVALAQVNFNQFNSNTISLLNGSFSTILPGLLSQQVQLDFVFIDGDHRKAATLNYFEQCVAKKNNTSVFVIDDIHWSIEMQQAWQQIKQHPEVTVTLDLFFIGIVFFRKEQVKEHFVIRF